MQIYQVYVSGPGCEPPMEETGANVILKGQQQGQIAHLPWSHPMLIDILFPLLTPHAPTGYLRGIPLAQTAKQRAQYQLVPQQQEVDQDSNEEMLVENSDEESSSDSGNFVNIIFLPFFILRKRK